MNICADCCRPAGTCSWEKDFTPVPGWEAKEKKLKLQSKGGNEKIVATYDITACPLFVPHPRQVEQRSSKPRPIVATNIVTGETRFFSSIRSAEKTGDFWGSCIHKCLSGKASFHYGHSFRYAERGEIE